MAREPKAKFVIFFQNIDGASWHFLYLFPSYFPNIPFPTALISSHTFTPILYFCQLKSNLNLLKYKEICKTKLFKLFVFYDLDLFFTPKLVVLIKVKPVNTLKCVACMSSSERSICLPYWSDSLVTYMKFTQPVPAGGAIQTKLRLVVGRWLTWEATTLHINWLPNWWSDMIPKRQKGREAVIKTTKQALSYHGMNNIFWTFFLYAKIHHVVWLLCKLCNFPCPVVRRILII